MSTYGREHFSVSSIMGAEQRSHIQEIIARNVMIFVFALLIWMANSQNVDLMAGAAASEWMTGIPVMDAPGSYENSLHVAYFNETGGVKAAVGLWMHRNLDMSPARLDKLRVLIQTVLIVYGVFLINNAMRSGPIAGAGAALLVFSSCFTGMGRGLNLLVTYVPSHAALSFAAGLFVIGMFMNGRRKIPLSLAGLIAIWDPVQAGVVLLLFWSVLLLRFKKEGGAKWMLIYIVMQAVSLSPAYLIESNFRVSSPGIAPENVQLWWKLMESRTTSIFPLNDGLLNIVDLWAAILAGFLIPLVVVRFHSRWKNRFSARGTKFAFLILGWVAAMWAAQVAAAHVFQLMPAATLSLTRVTPYATVLMCVFIAGAVEDMILSPFTWVGAVVLAGMSLFGMFVSLYAPLVVFIALAYARLKCGEDEWIKRWSYTAAGGFALMCICGALHHMIITFHVVRGGAAGPAMTAEYVLSHISIVLSTASFFGLCVRLFSFHRGVGDVRKRTTRAMGTTFRTAFTFATASFTVITLFANVRLAGSNFPYDLRAIEHMPQQRSEDRFDVEQWARYNTPENSLFVIDPHSFAGFEQTARRPALLQREEMLYPLKAPGTLMPVVERLRLLGVDAAAPEFDEKCGWFKSLMTPHCRQTEFYERLKSQYPSAVVGNLDNLRKDVPNARYLVIGIGQTAPDGFIKSHNSIYENSTYKVYDISRD